MKQLSQYLTIEPLIKQERFEDNFTLCNYGIERARQLITAGKEPKSVCRVQNKAYRVLEELLNQQDLIEDEDDELDEVEETYVKHKEPTPINFDEDDDDDDDI